MNKELIKRNEINFLQVFHPLIYKNIDIKLFRNIAYIS